MKRMTAHKELLSLKEFIDSVRSITYGEFLTRKLPETRVANEEAFVEMQSYILNFYDKTEALHSFADETDAIYDCIPVEQQPSLKGLKGSVPSAPDAPGHEHPPDSKDERQDSLVPSPLGPDKKDRFGNLMYCPPDTIPMRRVTIEQLTRFETLHDFFQKGPRGTGRPPRMIEPLTVSPTHRWAHAYQLVNNGGGHSYLNLWNPSIGTNQIFSLSQHWYIAGGSGGSLQTIECGWQVYPQFYGDRATHLFTYWTADNYNQTGCYNLTCNAFVQIPGAAWAPGMALTQVSTYGGIQQVMELAYWHTGGRWWLYVNGTSASNAIGYYPDTIYRGGALSRNATEIDYGGETVGTTSFPSMGSGHFAAEGWQKAAYQRTIGYYLPSGGSMVNASLTRSQEWPTCYTAELNTYVSPWFKALWFGGPGGNPC